MRHDGCCVNNEGLFVWKIILFDVDRYVGWSHAVLLITGLHMQRLYLQPPSDINTMSVVHAVRGPGTL